MGRSLDASFEPVLSGKVYDPCLGPFRNYFRSKVDKIWNRKKMKARRVLTPQALHFLHRAF